MTPPIPVCLAHRPVVGGLAAPYITVEHRDGGAVLGAVHGRRVDVCLARGLCQTCGRPLGERVVVFFRPVDRKTGYSPEPAMHPECAAYSARACPVLTGTMRHYRSSLRGLDGQPCGEPGCDCAGWVGSDDSQYRAGMEVEPFFAMWIRRRDYRPAVDEQGRPIGVALEGVEALRVRPVNPPARQQADLAEACAEALALMRGDGA